MRTSSVADRMSDERRQLDAGRSPAERVMLAFALGRRDLALYAATAGLSVPAARRAIERRRQARRRPSKVLDALLA